MRTLKKIFYAVCIIILLLCGIILYFAFNPQLSEQLADALYGEDYHETVEFPTKSPEVVTTPPPMTDGEPTPDVEPTPGVIVNPPDTIIDVVVIKPEQQALTYNPPYVSNVVIPNEMKEKLGFLPISGTTKYITQTQIEENIKDLTKGELGENLSFEWEMYPYYHMLNAHNQEMYKQVYANASKAVPRFIPCVNLSTQDLRTVMEAVYNDHPELFWLDTAFSCSYSDNGFVVEVTLQYNDTAEKLEESKEEFKKKAEPIILAAKVLPDDYEKEKYIHDTLVEMVEYDKEATLNQSAYSALVSEESVCAGYARAYQYLMQQVGIPCYYCTGYAGGSHAWNIVELYGEYYNVDVTWADTEEINYDYFNKNDEDYLLNHIRRDLSIYLPACNGNTYRNMDDQELVFDYEIPAVWDDIDIFYKECFKSVVQGGLGTTQFRNIVTKKLRDQLEADYANKKFEEAFLLKAMNRLDGRTCNIQVDIKALSDGTYQITHTVAVRK